MNNNVFFNLAALIGKYILYLMGSREILLRGKLRYVFDYRIAKFKCVKLMSNKTKMVHEMNYFLYQEIIMIALLNKKAESK